MRPYHVTYLSAQSQNEFIELIGREVQQRIVQEIKDAGMYSVMADTTPDVSHKDRLAIACRYVDKIGQPRERLVSLTEAKDKTGEGGSTEIIESLTEQGLDLDELCFQSYDYQHQCRAGLMVCKRSYKTSSEKVSHTFHA